MYTKTKVPAIIISATLALTALVLVPTANADGAIPVGDRPLSCYFYVTFATGVYECWYNGPSGPEKWCVGVWSDQDGDGAYTEDVDDKVGQCVGGDTGGP